MKLLERDAQLTVLRGLLSATGRGGGHIAVLAGEAGIGKTALIGAFTAVLPRHGRVLWGTCDPIDPPRPFGPVADVAARIGGPLRGALDAGDRARIFDAFLGVLREPVPGPTVLVLDDLHWADEATLDLLRVVGRRIRELPVLLLGAYRDHDVGADHPLRRAFGDLPSSAVTRITLGPLSTSAVVELAQGSATDGALLARATGGNPFYVTEVLAAGSADIPTTVRDAVLARVGRLSSAARRVLDAAAVLGLHCDADVLRRVEPHGPAAIDECVARAILERDGASLAYRHAIARQAVLDVMEPDHRVRLHRRALAVLAGSGVEAAQLVRHAVEAGDDAMVLGLAPVAGARAESLGSSREAAAHFATALQVATPMDPRSRANLLEAYARNASEADEANAALAAQHDALVIWRALGDRLHEGDGLRAMAGYLWAAGSGSEATAVALEAVNILETLDPPGPELGWAIAVVAQRLLVAGTDDPTALDWARRALEVAERSGDEPLIVHAMTTLGTLQVYMGDDAGWETLGASLARARAAGLVEHEGRALVNLLETANDMGRSALADRYVDEAMRFLDRHDADLTRRMVLERVAELAFERGRWDEAAAGAGTVLAMTVANPVRVRALTLLGRIRARRGDPDPWGPLDEAATLVDTGENQDRGPLIEARIEAAWLQGALPRAREEALVGIGLPTFGTGAPEPWAGLAFWAWKVGALGALPDAVDVVYQAHVAGRHREAARMWDEAGRPYQRALALSDSRDEGDLRAALDVFQRLSAAPMARAVTDSLRSLGASHIPRGPRATTQRHPAGLTARETEVPQLLGEDRTNAEIAAQLVLSLKTVDHHVSAVLRKLGVHSRADAVSAAHRRAPQDGEAVGPR